MNRRFVSVAVLCGVLMLSLALAGCGGTGAASSKPDSRYAAYQARIQEARTLIESGRYEAAQESLEQVQVDLRSALASGTIDASDKRWAGILYSGYFYKGEAARLMGNVSLALSSYASAIDGYADRVDTSPAREALVSAAYSGAVQYMKDGNDTMALFCLQQCVVYGGYKDAEVLKREYDYRHAVELMGSSFVEAQKAFNALPRGYKKVSSYLSRIKPYSAYMGAYHFAGSVVSEYVAISLPDEVLDVFTRKGHVYAKWRYVEYPIQLAGSSIRSDRLKIASNVYKELVVEGKTLRTYLEKKSEHYGPSNRDETWKKGASETGVVAVTPGGAGGSTGGSSSSGGGSSGVSGGSSGDWETNWRSALKKFGDGRSLTITQDEYDAWTQSEAQYNATH